ncbi:MAG: hypothetical protein II688_02525 [Lachnospiraceae bacterium]|nr:hypothetical protein [Lachnospiraceae bacterium]
MKKKTLIMISALTAAIALSGCGKDNSNIPADTKSQAVSEQTESTESKTTVDITEAETNKEEQTKNEPQTEKETESIATVAAQETDKRPDPAECGYIDFYENSYTDRFFRLTFDPAVFAPEYQEDYYSTEVFYRGVTCSLAGKDSATVQAVGRTLVGGFDKMKQAVEAGEQEGCVIKTIGSFEVLYSGNGDGEYIFRFDDHPDRLFYGPEYETMLEDAIKEAEKEGKNLTMDDAKNLVMQKFGPVIDVRFVNADALSEAEKDEIALRFADAITIHIVYDRKT